MIIPDIEKLYEPYSKTASLNDTVIWLRKQAGGLKIEPETVDEAISLVFLEMARGKTFEVDGRKFGFGNDHAHAELNHYMLDKCRTLNAEKVSIYLKLHQDRLNTLILGHIEADNKSFLAEFEVDLPPVAPTAPPSQPKLKYSPTKSIAKVSKKDKKPSKVSKMLLDGFNNLLDWSKSPILRGIGWTGLR